MSGFICPSCMNKGYQVDIDGDLARARFCPDCYKPCEICQGEGTVIRVDSRGYEIAVPCSCQRLAERISLFNGTMIPSRYTHCMLTTYDDKGDNQRQVHKLVHDHLCSYVPGAPGLLFYGKAGRGKTHLMVAILRELALEHGQRTRFVEFSHLLSDIKEGFNLGKSEAEVLQPVTRMPVLGVDELGKGLLTEWQLSILDEVISRRYNQRLTTYFTTNLPMTAGQRSTGGPVTGESRSLRRSLEAITLEDRVGERIFSRLYEMCTFVEVRGPDARRERTEGSAGRGR
ncbi:MAG: ATP-binding protein [Bradymonadales bacterium]|nr:ATP-binding protein [Bradymonadales bacterium]